MKLIFEELTKQENKKKFRELVKKHHPDRGGSEKIMKDLNTAADKGDIAFERFHDELLGKKPKEEPIKYDLDSEIKKQSDKYWGKEKDRTSDKKEFKILNEILIKMKNHKDVKGVRAVRPTHGLFPFFIDLKNGNHIQVEYTEDFKKPRVYISLIDKQGIPLAFKVTDNEEFIAQTVEDFDKLEKMIRSFIEDSKNAYEDDWRDD